MKTNRSWMWLAVVVGISLVGGAGQRTLASDGEEGDEHGDSRFQFAIMGDTQYNAEGIAQFPALRADINHDRRIRFTVHVGDFTGALCNDALYTDRLTDFNAFRSPLVFSPGDNDWTDCHRASQGLYNPLDRLARLRAVLFANPRRSLGQRPMPVWTQADEPGYAPYVENAMWVRGGVVFATVHMVGSNNGMNPWNLPSTVGPGYDVTDTTATPRADRVAEVNARQAAGLAWLNKAFDKAGQIKAAGVFILIQANPGFTTPLETAATPAAFVSWVDALRKRVVEFGRPVVLGHGDTHYARIDKPLTAATVTALPPAPAVPAQALVENFTRVETFGFPNTHWLRVTVDPRSDDVFSFHIETVDANRRQFAPIP